MLLHYKPDGVTEPATYEVNFKRVRRSEAIILEKQYGRTWAQFATDVMTGSVDALAALLWLVQRREHPTLRFDDLPDFYLEEVELDFSADEWRVMRDEARKSDDPQAAMAASVAEQMLAEAEAREAAAGEGKASSSSEASTA